MVVRKRRSWLWGRTEKVRRKDEYLRRGGPISWAHGNEEERGNEIKSATEGLKNNQIEEEGNKTGGVFSSVVLSINASRSVQSTNMIGSAGWDAAGKGNLKSAGQKKQK